MEKKKPRLGLSSGQGTLLTSEPGDNKISLGQTIEQLSTLLDSETQQEFDVKLASANLKQFHRTNARYVDGENLTNTTCSKAVKGWARERLHGLKIPYEIQARLKEEENEANMDKQASLHLVQLAEDFTLISKFCRDIQEVHINIATHPSGAAFHFEMIGPCGGDAMRVIENKGYDIIFSKFSKYNSLKLRVNISEEYAEMQVIVLKSEARLGFSPVD